MEFLKSRQTNTVAVIAPVRRRVRFGRGVDADPLVDLVGPSIDVGVTIEGDHGHPRADVPGSSTIDLLTCRNLSPSLGSRRKPVDQPLILELVVGHSRHDLRRRPSALPVLASSPTLLLGLARWGLLLRCGRGLWRLGGRRLGRLGLDVCRASSRSLVVPSMAPIAVRSALWVRSSALTLRKSSTARRVRGPPGYWVVDLQTAGGVCNLERDPSAVDRDGSRRNILWGSPPARRRDTRIDVSVSASHLGHATPTSGRKTNGVAAVGGVHRADASRTKVSSPVAKDRR